MLNINGRNYKLIYIDTNVLNSIAKNTNGFAKKFLTKYLNGKNNNMFVTSVFNIYELSNSSGESKIKLIEFFDLMPLAIMNTFPQLIEHEKYDLDINNEMILFATGHKESFNIKISTLFEMLDSPKMKISIETMMKNFEKENNKMIDNRILYNWKKEYELKLKQAMRDSLIIYNIDIDVIKLDKYKSLEVLSYVKNEFKFSTKKVLEFNSVIDCYNCSILPYVEEYITEATVASWLDSAKSRLKYLENKKIISWQNILREIEN